MDCKIVVIAGASKGIGKGIAEYFIGKGYFVHGCSRGKSNINSENYRHGQLDLTDETAVRDWVKEIIKISGKIDILMCCAAFASANMLAIMTSGKIFHEMIKTNILGTFIICREVSKVMMKHHQGRIITMSSMAAGLHLEGASGYAATKSAVVELTKVLAKELAPFGITCNVIAPSMYMTEAVNVLDEEGIKRALETLTIKRVLAIEELINVIEFYCDEKSACITGQVLYLGLVD